MSAPLFTTPDLCDDHPDDFEVVDPGLSLRDYGGEKNFWGRIVTVKCCEDNSFVKKLAAAPGNGSVMVVDGAGSLRRALLGDQVAANAKKNGWSGFIIYGCIRDAEIIATLPIGVKALNTVPVKTVKRDIGDLDVPVCFGGVTFTPGEYVYCDVNGIITSPKNFLA